MCNGNCNGCKNASCLTSKIVKVLLVVGALNWGLVGVGMLAGKDLNVVNMILGSMPAVEGVIYVLVGLAGLMSFFHCRCKTCSGGSCANCSAGDSNTSA